MNIRYESGLGADYMILDSVGKKPEPMCIQMLKKQKIKGVLPVHIFERNAQFFYHYEITSLHNLTQCNIQCFDRYKIRHMLCSILSIINESKFYFLCEADFIINPDTIYFDESSMKLSLAYVSGYHTDLFEQLQKLLEYLMDRIDYRNQETVQYVYSLYELLVREQSTPTVFMDILLKEAIQQPYMTSDTLTREVMTEVRPETDTFRAKQDEQQQEVENDYECEMNLLPVIGMTILSCIFLIFLCNLGAFHTLFGEFRHLRFFVFVFLCSITGTLFGILFGYHGKSVLRKGFCVTEQIEPTSAIPNRKQVLLLVPREASYSTLEIQEFPCYIGRKEGEVDIAILDIRVSRFHAKITMKDEKYYLIDTKSRYGTYLNDRKLKPKENKEVIPGDRIRFASIEYVLETRG